MDTVILEKKSAPAMVAIDDYVANLQTPPEAVSPDAWADLVASLRYTHDLARLARELAV